MNKAILSLTCALAASVAFAADETTSTTTTTTTTRGTGTVTEYTPGSTFVVKETSGPVKYKYGKKVRYRTKKGKDLTEEEVRTRVKVGSPVSVEYKTEGTDRVIESVEVDDD